MRWARARAVWIGGMVCAALLQGCAVGPNFKPPAAPNADITAPALSPEAAQTIALRPVGPAWWNAFGSPYLDATVARALAANPDLAAARAAFRVAEENYRAGIGSFLPSVSGSASATRARDATGAVAPTAASGNPSYSLESVQISASYTLDLLGGTRRQVEALSAQADNARFAAAAAYVGLTANVVRAVIQDAALETQVQATTAMLAAQNDALGIFRKQLAAGQIAGLDVIAQEAAVAQTEQQLLALEKQRALQRDLVAALCGDYGPKAEAGPALADLRLPAELPLSVASDLVARRADVRAAEASVHAASAGIGVAVANMLPNIAITAAWGSTANRTPDLFMPETTLWNVAGSLAQPLFAGGTLLHKKRAAVAAYHQALAQYRSTVIGAFHDVGDALAAIKADAPTVSAANRAEQATAESLRIVTRQVNLGQAGYLALLSAQQAYQQAVVGRIQAQASQFADSVALIQALGGDWWQSGSPMTAPQTAAGL